MVRPEERPNSLFIADGVPETNPKGKVLVRREFKSLNKKIKEVPNRVYNCKSLNKLVRKGFRKL